MNWNSFCDCPVFLNRIALNEGRRRGWFSYSDFNVLMEHRDWYTTISELLDQSMKVCLDQKRYLRVVT